MYMYCNSDTVAATETTADFEFQLIFLNISYVRKEDLSFVHVPTYILVDGN